MIDGEGIHGFVLPYALLFALFGAALIVFLYFGIKGRLGFDEEAKFHLFNDEDGS